jgi:hypothetical protein
MILDVGGDKGVSRVQSVKDGSTLTFEFRAWTNDPSRERLDPGHKGPCAVYLKKVDSAIDDPGHGDGWFKIHEDDYDAGSGEWCSDKLIAKNGYYSVTLPKGLQGGYYLARPELLALHAANQGDPQFYAGCAQIFLESNGDLGPAETVSIPGYVKAGEDSVSFDIYNRDNSEYTLPGPKIAELTSAASANAGSQIEQTEGQRPEGCICENGNWCGKEVPDYNSEGSCWESAQNCWTQADECWNSAPPTGGKGCEIWQSKCENIKNQCASGNFQGPPNKGKDLTPRRQTIDVGAAPAAGNNVVDTPKTSAAAEVKTKAPVEAKPSPTPAPAPAPETAYPDETEGEKEFEAEVPAAEEPKPVAESSQPIAEDPKPTPSVPSYQEAPAPTPAPETPEAKSGCVDGQPCVTKWETVVKTETVYVTMAGESKKRRSFHARRH